MSILLVTLSTLRILKKRVLHYNAWNVLLCHKWTVKIHVESKTVLKNYDADIFVLCNSCPKGRL